MSATIHPALSEFLQKLGFTPHDDYFDLKMPHHYLFASAELSEPSELSGFVEQMRIYASEGGPRNRHDVVFELAVDVRTPLYYDISVNLLTTMIEGLKKA